MPAQQTKHWLCNTSNEACLYSTSGASRAYQLSNAPPMCGAAQTNVWCSVWSGALVQCAVLSQKQINQLNCCSMELTQKADIIKNYKI